MNKRLYVDFHILQTVPPSCINRDDTGSPKTAVYGGVLRARVSSQAWKHAMRAAFAENAQLDVGKRTKKGADLVKEQILPLAPDADADKLANELHELSEDICKNLGSGAHSITYSASEWRRLDAKIQKILEQQSDTLYLLKKLADQAVSWSPERMNKPDTPVHTDIKAVQTVPRRGRRVPWLLRVQSTTSRYQALEKRMEVPA